MNAEIIHRLHFAFTVTFHYLFPQLTMGLAFIIVIGILTILTIVGSSNAVNLTDGLDGLAIGCTIIAAGALAFPFTDFGLQSGSGDFLVVPGSNCADGLAAGGDKCTVDVQMNAQSLGTSSTTMVAQNTANGQSANVVLTGTGAAAVLVFTPATDVVRDFGTVRKGDLSAPLTYTVRNVGGLASGVITFGLYEDAAGTTAHTGDFSFAGSTCGVTTSSDGTLAAGASCNIQVAFSPTTATVTPIPDEYLIVKATPGHAAPGLVSKAISAAAAAAATGWRKMTTAMEGLPLVKPMFRRSSTESFTSATSCTCRAAPDLKAITRGA